MHQARRALNVAWIVAPSQKHTKAVNEAFCKFFEDGLIYRENRLCNWCVAMNTTLSNLEVRNATRT